MLAASFCLFCFWVGWVVGFGCLVWTGAIVVLVCMGIWAWLWGCWLMYLLDALIEHAFVLGFDIAYGFDRLCSDWCLACGLDAEMNLRV